ncbi:hypothetical protein BDQ12DRAFT_247241 [Crucibulum laeve]|uniref:Uncharacterized protein n=1 Tax=Crucibulum laeve TaxID=68775 RepID=A0A5C3LT04_9AGAR|nr:hypothetical protein BDQ12DRAFT_247241 [Crucibulum laeve]
MRCCRVCCVGQVRGRSIELSWRPRGGECQHKDLTRGTTGDKWTVHYLLFTKQRKLRERKPMIVCVLAWFGSSVRSRRSTSSTCSTHQLGKGLPHEWRCMCNITKSCFQLELLQSSEDTVIARESIHHESLQ